MLSRENRLTSSSLFSHTVRRGRRAGARRLVVHLETDGASTDAPRIGLVVSKGVGPAVTRNLVKRRLRHLCRTRLEGLPHGVLLVVRALPPAADATSADLGRDLDRALGRVLAANGPS